jgi:hypothetical protein
MQPTPSQPSQHAGQEPDSWQPIPFNATDWQRDGAPTYRIEDGVLVFDGDGRGRLMSRRTYSDFELQVEFRVSAGANNGIAIRAPLGFQASRYGMEVQILDDAAHEPLDMRSACGALYGLYPAVKSAVRPAGEWNTIHIRCIGRRVQVTLNGERVSWTPT